MTKVLRILSRFNIGGPVYNASYLTAHMPDDYDTLLVGGPCESDEGDSTYVAHSLGIDPILIKDMHREISLGDDAKAYLQIRKLIKDFKPDIVHTHTAKAGTLGRMAALHCGVEHLVHTFHGNIFSGYFNSKKERLFKGIERYLAKRSSAIVAISEGQKLELTQKHRICKEDRISVIPLGLDLQRFQQNTDFKRESFRAKYQISEELVAIGIIGRLSPIKNHDLFIKAIAYAKKHSHSQIQAFIIGDGSERRNIEETCKIMGLSSSRRPSPNADVILTSWIHDLEEPIAGLDIICLSSFNEGTPVSLIEAQAGKKPIVTTNAGGTSEILVPGESALVSDVRNENEYYSNLLELIDQPEKREEMGRKGYEYVINRYTIDHLILKTHDLYQRLLA